jgi:hypothetical protein
VFLRVFESLWLELSNKYHEVIRILRLAIANENVI